MTRTIFVPREGAGEERVAASPDTVKRLSAMGFQVVVEAGAGTASGILDADFEAAGARIGRAADAATADVILKVNRPTSAEIERLVDTLRDLRLGELPLLAEPHGDVLAAAHAVEERRELEHVADGAPERVELLSPERVDALAVDPHLPLVR